MYRLSTFRMNVLLHTVAENDRQFTLISHVFCDVNVRRNGNRIVVPFGWSLSGGKTCFSFIWCCTLILDSVEYVIIISIKVRNTKQINGWKMEKQRNWVLFTNQDDASASVYSSGQRERGVACSVSRSLSCVHACPRDWEARKKIVLHFSFAF